MGLDFFTSILGEEDYVKWLEYVRREYERNTYTLIGVRSANKSGNPFMRTRIRLQQIGYKEVERMIFCLCI